MTNQIDLMGKRLTNKNQKTKFSDRIRALIFWSTFCLATVMLFNLDAVLFFWNRIFNPKKITETAHWVACLWARAIMHAAPGWKWSYRGFENLPRAGEPPVVLVANHQSAADIGAVYLTDCQFRWLSKDTVFRLPFIGVCMRWAGYVPIKRGDRKSHEAALEASAAWIRRGISMFYFPEGTRSEDGQLRDFKVGAFRLAMEERVAISPIVLSGTREMMVKNSGLPRPAHLILEVLPKVWPLPEEKPDQFAERVRELIKNRLDYLESIR